MAKSLRDEVVESDEAEFTDGGSSCSESDDEQADHPTIPADGLWKVNFNNIELEEINIEDLYACDVLQSEEAQEEAQYFPQFMQLPTELRWFVWEYAFPVLQEKPRVLSMCLIQDEEQEIETCDVIGGELLSEQTLEQRQVQAINQETRLKALRRFPNVIRIYYDYFVKFEQIRCQGIVRFDPATDIIVLERICQSLDLQRGSFVPEEIHMVPAALADHVRFIGFNIDWESDATACHMFLRKFRNLQRVYFVRKWYNETQPAWQSASTTVLNLCLTFDKESAQERSLVNVQWVFPFTHTYKEVWNQFYEPVVPSGLFANASFERFIPPELAIYALPMVTYII